MPTLGRHTSFIALIITLCLVSALLGFARAADADPGTWIVVAPYGRDDGRGDLSDPLRSIEAAVARARPGNTILVRAGTYMSPTGNLSAPLEFAGVRGTPDQPIRLLGEYGAPRPVRRGSGWQVIRIFQSSHIEVENFELVGTSLADQAPTAGVEIRESHHIAILGNVIHDVGGSGVSAIQSDHIRVQGNHVFGATKWSPYQTSAINFFEARDSGHGVAPSGFNNVVYGNLAWQNETLVPGPEGKVTDGNCVIVDYGHTHRYPYSTLIQNNICIDHGGRGINVFHSDNVMAVNNTLINNVNRLDQPGAELNAVSASNVVFRNNLVSAKRSETATLTSDSRGVTFDHNLFVGPAPRALGFGDSVVGAMALIDRTAPSPSSAAVDRGSVDSAPQLDIYGKPRRGAPDIGAIEA